MAKMFYEEYSENLEGMRNVLLNYYLQFRELKQQAEKDHQNGKLTDEEYEIISKYRIDEYHRGKNGRKSPYSLTKKQAEIVHKYANLTDTGELYLDSIQDKYKIREKKLYTIFNSIRTFYYYESLSLEEKKMAFSAIVTEYYDTKISKLNAALTCGATRLTIDGEELEGRFIPARISNLELHKQSALAKIVASDYGELIKFISEFNDVDYKYYEWFKNKSLRAAASDQTIYAKHQERLKEISNCREEISKLQEERTRSALLLSGLDNSYIELSQQKILALPDGKKPSLKERFLKKFNIHPKDNLDELRLIFNSYMSLPAFNIYISSLDKYNMTDLFTIFMSNKYPLIKYVEPFEFKNTLFNSLETFINKERATLGERIKSLSSEITEKVGKLRENISISEQEASYQLEISNSLKHRAYLNEMDEDEEERVYSDMVTYFKETYPQELIESEKRNTYDLQRSEGNHLQSN